MATQGATRPAGPKTAGPDLVGVGPAVGQDLCPCDQRLAAGVGAGKAISDLERRRIARDLHDALGGSLTAARIAIEMTRRRTLANGASAAQIDAALGECIVLVDAAIGQVRDAALGLHPAIVDDLGIDAALRWLVDRASRSAALECDLRVDLDPCLPVDVEIAAFRITEEALTNVVRHAGATRVEVALRSTAGGLELGIADDGCGYLDTARAAMHKEQCLGIVGMRERAEALGGTFAIEPRPVRGTVIRVTLPFGGVAGIGEARRELARCHRRSGS